MTTYTLTKDIQVTIKQLELVTNQIKVSYEYKTKLFHKNKSIFNVLKII